MMRDRDSGFTLIELMISVGILGVIMSAIAAAMFTSVKASSQGEETLTDSSDVLVSSAYFGNDAQGANTITAGQMPPKCGTGTLVVEFAGTDFDAALARQTTVVSYVLASVPQPDGSIASQLLRQECGTALPAPAYPLSPVTTITVAKQLSPATTPTVHCPADSSQGCIPTAPTVSVTLTAASGSVFSLTGTRRTT